MDEDDQLLTRLTSSIYRFLSIIEANMHEENDISSDFIVSPFQTTRHSGKFLEITNIDGACHCEYSQDCA